MCVLCRSRDTLRGCGGAAAVGLDAVKRREKCAAGLSWLLAVAPLAPCVRFDLSLWNSLPKQKSDPPALLRGLFVHDEGHLL